VAVTAVGAPASAVQGSTVSVSVTVANQGNVSETFSVSLAATGGSVGGSPQTVTLAAGGSTTLTFSWNTTGASLGTHTLTATAATVAGETDTADNSLAATVGVTAAPAGNASDMYVWNIVFSSSGSNGTHRERVSVTIRRDSNANGLADSLDAVVSGASVTVKLYNSSGGLVPTFSGTTNAEGIFRTSRITLAAGTYRAEVDALTHATYSWNQALDPAPLDTDLDLNNKPDQAHTIPH
jgi:hypothetical protein